MTAKRRSGEQVSPITASSREQWLAGVSRAIAGWLQTMGAPLPPCRVISGFPSRGRRSYNIAEAYPEEDGLSFRLVVNPDATDPVQIAAAIAQQLAAIAAGSDQGAQYRFRQLAVSMGLRGTKRESPPGLLFGELVEPVLRTAGPLPTADTPATPILAIPKQSSRLVRVACSQCGYVVRVARKWLMEMGPPHCPKHGKMHISEK